MFANAKKILITTESREVFVIRAGGETSISRFCPRCGERVEMLSLDAATSRMGIRSRELISRWEDGELHSMETATGHLLICKRSLTEQTEETELKTNFTEEFGGKLWD